MRGLGPILLLGLGAAILPACTYHGALKPIITASDSRLAVSRKIPVQVALLRNRSLSPFRAHGGGHGVEIDYSEALATELVSGLGSIFERVRLIEDPREVGTEEILGQYSFRYQQIQRDDWTGRHVFRTSLGLQLRDDARNRIFAYEHTEDVEYSPPADAKAATFLTGFSLYLLTPITAPITTQAIGREATRLMENTVKISTVGIKQKILADSRLSSTAGPPSSTSRPETARPSLPVDPIPRSKYEDFLSSVVVVRTSRALGTGFFVSPGGLILTNYHVVEAESTVSVKLYSGGVVLGRVVASRPEADLALIEVSQRSPSWLELAGSDEGGVGNEVIAIGTPNPAEPEPNRGSGPPGVPYESDREAPWRLSDNADHEHVHRPA